MFLFIDRNEAGEKLAARLAEDPLVKEAGQESLLVLSIPRGGVVVGAAVARALSCAHQIIAVKKIGFPGYKELAIGAIAEDGQPLLDWPTIRMFRLRDEQIQPVIEQVQTQLQAYIEQFRHGQGLEVQAKTVILIDDGMATGETMKAAVLWLAAKEGSHRPRQVIVAVPVASPRVAGEFEQLVNKFISLEMPEWFRAVGVFYWNFDQVEDDEVMDYLAGNKAGN